MLAAAPPDDGRVDKDFTIRGGVTVGSDEFLCWTFAGWETDHYYRRLGRSSTPFLGHGAWLDDWRARITSAETMRELAESGVTVIVTHFCKGMGRRADAAEWPRLRTTVARAHEAGLKVWGYVQGGSLFYETMLVEHPELMEWVARGPDGRPRTWAGQYYRLMPCLTSMGYRDYVADQIRDGLGELALDGIHLDNSYSRHCWCDRCAEKFREWLTAVPNLEDHLGFNDVSAVAPPPIRDDQRRVTDPLQILWLEFGVQNRLAALAQWRDALKQANPDATFVHNPAFPRATAAKTRLAVDPAREGAFADALFAENGSRPRVEAGRIISQAEAFLYGEAGGYRVLSTTWERSPSAGHAPPASAGRVWVTLAEEFSYPAAVLGNNWWLRPMGDGPALIGDNPELASAFSAATQYFRSLAAQLGLRDRRSWSELAVLVEPDTLAHCADTDLLATRQLVSELLRRQIPFRMVFGGQEIPSDVRALLVVQQTNLSAERLDQIRHFAEAHDRAVVVVGSTGANNEWGIPRDRSVWRAWRASPGFCSDDGAAVQWGAPASAGGHLDTDAPEVNEACRQALDTVLGEVASLVSVRFNLPFGVLVHAEHAPEGAVVFHLRDQSGAQSPGPAGAVRLAGPWTDPVFFSPSQEARPLTIKEDNTLALPEFCHYAALRMRRIHTGLRKANV